MGTNPGVDGIEVALGDGQGSPAAIAHHSCRPGHPVAGGGQGSSLQRYSACKDSRGEWQLTQA